MLDEKFAKFEHSFRNDIANLRNDLNSVKQLSKKELSKVRESINDTGDGQNSLRRNLKSKKRR